MAGLCRQTLCRQSLSAVSANALPTQKLLICNDKLCRQKLCRQAVCRQKKCMEINCRQSAKFLSPYGGDAARRLKAASAGVSRARIADRLVMENLSQLVQNERQPETVTTAGDSEEW